MSRDGRNFEARSWGWPEGESVLDEFLSHWTGNSVSTTVVARCVGSCASRQAPALPRLQRSRLLERFQDDAAAGEHVWREDLGVDELHVHYARIE